MKVRNAVESDLPRIVDIACRARQDVYAAFIEPSFWDGKRAELAQIYRDILAEPSSVERCLFSVAEGDGDSDGIIGYSIAGYISEKFRAEFPLHWIREIFFAPGSTGKGQGAVLMATMARHFMEMEPGPLGLSVGTANARARGFYERLGGKIYGTSDDNIVYGRIVPSVFYVWNDASDLYEKAMARARSTHPEAPGGANGTGDGHFKFR